MGVARAVRWKTSRGAEDARHPFGKIVWVACAALLALALSATVRKRDLADQGPRQYRGRAAEPADRLRPRGRPQRHRRHAQQHPLHQAVAAGDARAHGRQHPRRHHPHRQRRRRDGHRQPAGLRHPGHADGRHGLRARRRQEPAGRHPARHPPARRRRQCLCGGAGLARDRAASQAEGAAASITRGVPTVGRIANGAIIEREIEFALNRLPNVRLALRNADFTTAKRIAAAVNDFLGVKTAEPIDPSTVQLSIPAEFKGNVVAFLTEIEQLQVEPDLAAKIVIDERSGIIVMGRDVRVATVAVAQGNLTVTISESPQVSQPNPLSRGRTVVTPRTQRQRQRGRQEVRGRQGRRLAAAARRRPQRARHRPARPDQHPAGDQGRRRDPGRHRGDVMQTADQHRSPARKAVDASSTAARIRSSPTR